MRDIAIVSFAQLPNERRAEPLDEGEMVEKIVNDAMGQVGLTQDDIGFTVSGSADYLIGRPFSFVAAVDGLVTESQHLNIVGEARPVKVEIPVIHPGRIFEHDVLQGDAVSHVLITHPSLPWPMTFKASR